MEIGRKIKELRLKLGLTQEELANRTELSKGFISQLERDLTSPSITSLADVLECLGTNLSSFFSEERVESVVYTPADIFQKEDGELKHKIEWLVPTAQKNQMEPILISIDPGGESMSESPHEGEEFGYVISGGIQLILGENKHKVKKGDSFYFKPTLPHCIKNTGSKKAVVLWVATPPSF